ncbi:MAG: alpha/beta hydrolase [Bdellovibrionota bacterium]
MILRVLAVVVAILVLLIVIVVLAQRRLLYPVRYKNRDKPSPTATRRILYRDIDGGRVEAWLLLPGNAIPKGLIVHAHGNGEILDMIESGFLHYCTDEGYAVLMPEYRGYSRSQGDPTLDNIMDDFTYFLGEALKLYPDLKDKTVYHGRSLGGGVVAEFARRIRPRGIVLESTFTSVGDVAHELFMMPRAWVWDDYSPETLLRSFDGPVLIIHGRQDEVIPYHLAERNLASAKHARLVTFDGLHNDTMSRNLKAYRMALKDFLSSLTTAKAE